MKKYSIIPMLLLLLAASALWALPSDRKHTRPPYNGPRQKVNKPNLPAHPPKGKTSPHPKGQSGHIIVR